MIAMGGSKGQKPINKASLSRVVTLFSPYKPQVGWITLLVLLSAGLGLLSPFFLKIIVNDGLLNHHLDVVMKFSALTMAATLGSTALGLGFAYVSVLVGQKIMRDLRNNLYDHLQGMSLKFFTGTRTGEIQSRPI